ncbi:aldehyde dehydrogenase family protein [Coralliovum pocilloporae]|uniref:aldehyde dehydrogenase family protein n=1 Tax=Coralliovum pocilloporae TaxID=3066369 RepID=UPI003307BB45
MSASLSQLIEEARSTGTLSGLPKSNFIDGQWVDAESGARMETYDPGTGKAYADFAASGAAEVDRAIAAAEREQYGRWRDVTPQERGAILRRAAQLVEENAERLAVVETLDSGKSIGEAQGDVAGTARVINYYAGLADKIHGETINSRRSHLTYTLREPLGVTAHIIPWNYPTSTLARGIAPALAAGCTVVAKPAETTPLTALMLADLFQKAGLPDGVLNVVTGTGSEAGAPLVEDKRIRHITFTGSVRTGVQVGQVAMRNVASTILELGGKSPFIALADCDMDRAVDDAVWAIYSNAGQICSAGSRLVIDRAIHEEFVARVVEKARGITVGHGLGGADVGAINNPMQLEKVHGFVERARERGRTVLCGGETATDAENGGGWFYRPTLIDNVPSDDEVIQDEIFGPVLSVQVVDGIEEAITAANCTDFGLMSCVYTQDVSKALRVARDLDTGQVSVNDYWANGWDVPFGGTKLSGIGREKGTEGLEGYLQTKGVSIRIDG